DRRDLRPRGFMANDDWRPKLLEITDILVEGRLAFRGPDGRDAYFNVRVGRPCPWDKGYYCPLEVEGFLEGVKPVFGVGPIDSLMNAMSPVRTYCDHKDGLSTEPLPKI